MEQAGAAETHRSNWSGNYTYHARQLVQPRTVAEVQQAVRSARSVRALGSRHSFNGIADCADTQISLEHLREMKLDVAARTVTIGGGVRYGELAPWLDARGFALRNLASLPHITVAGACATGTHGSGRAVGCLPTSVCAMELVDGRGETVRLSRAADGERFAGAVVGLGALGIVTSLTLEVEPAFAMRQEVFLDLPFRRVAEQTEAVFGAGYSVSLFTNWQGGRATQMWVKSRVDPGARYVSPAERFGAARAEHPMHPLVGHPAEHCTEQGGHEGRWYERMPHFRMDFTPSSGQEIQAEYLVPFDQGLHAVAAVEELRDEIAPLLLVSELRAVAADDLWMSPCFGRETMALHFTWKPMWPAVQELLPKIEMRLQPLSARPHWGKVFAMQPGELRALYPRLREFRELAAQFDPEGKLRNAFLNETLFD